jgi:hypothetical protein
MRYLPVIFSLLLTRALFAADYPAAIVNTPVPLVIDGQTTDWAHITAEGAITTPDERPAATFKLACDDTHLYALFSVIDASPLKNGAAIPQELLKGGDAVGMCLGHAKGQIPPQRLLLAQLNGKPVLMVYRPKWPTKQPHTFASPVKSVTLDYVGPLDGAQTALKLTPNGYVAEMALPLKALGLKASGTYLFDAQIIFSDPAGTTNSGTAWWHTVGSDAFTVEDLPTEASLFPALWGDARFYGSDPGPRPTSVSATAKAPGIPIVFDLPRAGKTSLIITDAKGFVLRELLRAEPMTAGRHTVAWDGRDRYDEPLAPGSYRWKLAVFDGMGTRFLGSVGNSARPPYRTADGKGSMGGQHGGASVIGADGEGIYLLGGTEEGHPAMRKIAPDGRTLWKRSMGGFGSGRAIAGDATGMYYVQSQARGEVAQLIHLDPKTGQELPINGKTGGIRLGDKNFIQTVAGMAIAGGKAYFSLPKEGQLAVVSLATGEAMPAIALEAPLGLCTRDESHLLICAGTSVLTLDTATGQATPFVTGLQAPRAVARDAQGNVYVSDLGDSQQIKRYAADGIFLGAIGTPGGRPLTQNPYDPASLRNVVSVAVGPDNHLWLVEYSSLRRVARFTLDGKWVADQYGPVAYNVVGPDLDDLSTVYYQTSQGTPSYARTTIDYAAYARDPENPLAAWRIAEVMYLTQSGTETPAETDLMVGAMKPGYGHVVAFTAANGQRYLWRLAKHNRAILPSGAAIWRWEKGRWVPACFVTNDLKDGKSWSDANGDGLVQPEELYAPAPTNRFAWLDRSLTLYGFGGTLTPARINARGVPVYDGGAYKPYLLPKEPPLEDGWVFNSMPDANGAVYYAANYGTHRHLSFWDRACENQIAKVQDGRVQWIIGQHDAHARRDSDLTTVSGIAGIVDDLVIAHTVEPSRYIAFTADGLTLGNVIVDETGRQPSVGPTAIYIESFTGLFLKDPKTGKRVLFSVRSGDDPILEVTGPGNLTRLEGAVALDTSRPRELLPAKHATIPYESWWGNVGRGYGIDGYDWEWLPKSSGLSIRDGKALIGDIRLRRDAGALHVLANTLSAPLVSAGLAVKDPAKAWGAAEGVELLLAPADAPTKAVRVLLAIGGDGKALAYSYRTTGEKPGWAPLPGAKVAVLPRWGGMGWRLEAELPLSALPDVSTPTLQTYRRGTGDLETLRKELPDLVLPLSFNAAIWRREADGKLRRLPWVEDGHPQADPGILTPAKWGSVSGG